MASSSGRRSLDRPRPFARHGRLRRSRAVGAVFRTIAMAVAVVLVSTVAVAGVAVWRLSSSLTASTVHLEHESGATAPPGIDAISGGVNLLLVGTDTRTGQGSQFADRADLAASSGAGNNDVTILLHIAQDHRSAMVVSFPRDLILNLPACPSPKGGSYLPVTNAMLNSSLARGGLACPVLTIEKLIPGLTIPYAASISFDGVAAMSNAVGGVTVCVATAISDPYTGLFLPAGEHTIQGDVALAFVRTRHGVGDGSDLGRISNQQVFLSALARKVESEGVLKNPIEVYSLAQAATQHMQLSDTLAHLDTMASIALALKSVPLDNIVMVQYPTGSNANFPNRVVPVTSDAAVNRALVDDEAVTLTGSTGRGSIVDTHPTAEATPTPTAAPTGENGKPLPAKEKGELAHTPASTAPPVPTTALPSTVTGQTAAQQTCSKGQKGG
ncbi:MAG TPA: LCP family protein [Pseudolysinimonas sp.]|nr:LCP family protein [Pseudolysinimonas sp.]